MADITSRNKGLGLESAGMGFGRVWESRSILLGNVSPGPTNETSSRQSVIQITAIKHSLPVISSARSNQLSGPPVRAGKVPKDSCGRLSA